MWTSLEFTFAMPKIDKAGSRKPLACGRGRYRYPTPSRDKAVLYARNAKKKILTGIKIAMLEVLATYASGVYGLHGKKTPQTALNVKKKSRHPGANYTCSIEKSTMPIDRWNYASLFF